MRAVIEIPDQKSVPAVFRKYLAVWMADDDRPESISEKGAGSVQVKILKASFEFTPFTYDRHAQVRDYLGKTRIHTQVWYRGKMIKEMESRYRQVVSVIPREHFRVARLNEFEDELIQSAIYDWLVDLNWMVSQGIRVNDSGAATVGESSMVGELDPSIGQRQ